MEIKHKSNIPFLKMTKRKKAMQLAKQDNRMVFKSGESFIVTFARGLLS